MHHQHHQELSHKLYQLSGLLETFMINQYSIILCQIIRIIKYQLTMNITITSHKLIDYDICGEMMI